MTAQLPRERTLVAARQRDMRDAPPPYPYGWYAAAFAKELGPGRVLTRRFMDREIVLFRTRSGTVRAIDAHCPHLGAHLGHGGRVVGETLQCPFHGFRYDIGGRCVYTPYGPPPPAAHLGLLALQEVCGVLMVYHGPGPRWSLTTPFTGRVWRTPRTHTFRLRSHPQEVTENSVDLGHFGALHGFSGTRVISPLAVDGPRLSIEYAAEHPFPLVKPVPTRIDIRIQGLGFSAVELTLLNTGRVIRQLVLTTPVAEREVVVHVSTSFAAHETSPLPQVVRPVADWLLGDAALCAVIRDLHADKPIWEHKRYVGRPALNRGDGPIGRYRAWAAQFYEKGNAS